jgi:hypothetical protein
MNNQPNAKNTWIWATVVIVIAAIGYFYFYGSSSSTTASSGLVQTSSGDSSDVGSQVLTLLNQINSLNIDTSLFTDPGYQTLRDYSVAIPSVNVGRPNPFAPLPGFSTTTSVAH